MKRFKQIYLEESVQSKEVSALNSYIKRSLKGVKFTSSSRGGYHTRFALNMTPKQYKIYFAKAGLEVQAYNGPSVSSSHNKRPTTHSKGYFYSLGEQLYWCSEIRSTAIQQQRLKSR